MNKVLFISPTTYSDPVTKDIQIKFKSLSKVCNPIVFAFSDKKSTTVIEGVETIFNKKNKNRFLNYLKIIFLFFFKIPSIVKNQNVEIICLQDPITGFFVILSLKIRKLPVKIVVETHGDFIDTINLEKNLLLPKLYSSIFSYLAFPAWINIENYLNAEIDRSFIDTFKIIFVGSVTERKNPKIIIESIETIDTKISIEIIGQTPNLKYLKELKELISQSKHSQNIILTPFIPSKELIKKYSSANLFILPSKSEGLGRVIIEAQSTACPVLVSSNTGMTDLIIENETGYIFENNNKQDLKDKIEYIIKNYDTAVQAGLNSREFVKDNQSVKNFEFGYKKLFDLVFT